MYKVHLCKCNFINQENRAFYVESLEKCRVFPCTMCIFCLAKQWVLVGPFRSEEKDVLWGNADTELSPLDRMLLSTLMLCICLSKLHDNAVAELTVQDLSMCIEDELLRRNCFFSFSLVLFFFNAFSSISYNLRGTQRGWGLPLCTGFGWESYFPSLHSNAAVLWICDENSADNTPLFICCWAVLVPSQGLSWFLFWITSEEMRVHKELRRGHRATDPSWLKGYFTQYGWWCTQQ